MFKEIFSIKAFASSTKSSSGSGSKSNPNPRFGMTARTGSQIGAPSRKAVNNAVQNARQTARQGRFGMSVRSV